MSFLAPWLAIGVAAVVVPTLLILYFLKLRRREEPISSTLLWKRAVQDLQVNAPFQRLRRNLLLLLQLLILGLAITALARPIVETEVANEDRIVLLIDHSASMNTVEEGGKTRLDLAKEQAIRLVKTLNRRSSSWRSFLTFGAAEARTQVMVIAFAERARMVSPFTTNASDLAELIEQIEPTDGQTDMKEALELAEAYMAPPTLTTDKTPISAEVPSKLVLISDGRVANLDQQVLKSGELELIRIGEATDNVGITALRTQRNYERPELLSVFLAVQNFGFDPITTDVSIYVDETLEAVKSVELGGQSADEKQALDDEAGASASLSFELPLNRAAVLEARIARRDALDVDNRAYVAVPPPKRLRVLVVTEGNTLINYALAGQPLTEFPFVTPVEYEANAERRFYADDRSKFDVVIMDRYSPEALLAGNYLFFGITPPLEGFATGEKQEWYNLIWWDETHPVLRHVQLSPVIVSEGVALEIPELAEVLIEGPQGPVLVRYSGAGRHCLVMSFAVEKSPNWWSTGFPVFLFNAVRYLGGATEAADEQLRPGATLRIPAVAGTDSVRVVRPDKRRVTVSPGADGVAYYGETNRVGIYRVDDGVPGRDRFAVNLEDPWESEIAPPTEPLRVGSQEIAQMELIKTATPEVWRWFVGVALVLVLLEWWIYNRRVMI